MKEGDKGVINSFSDITKSKSSDLVSLLLKKSQTKEAGKKKQVLSRFFKTAPGDYAAGDIFLGITVPELRVIARSYFHLSLKELEKLLNHKAHEVRFISLIILTSQYEKSQKGNEGADNIENIITFYLNNSQKINNWDLVDVSSHKILGHYLLDKTKEEVDSILLKLANSDNIWQRRIAIVSTWAFIKAKRKRETFMICEKLLYDEEELIHKACGWMLREVGKRISEEELEIFLRKHINEIPRISLRYALEKFAKQKKIYYYSLGRK